MILCLPLLKRNSHFIIYLVDPSSVKCKLITNNYYPAGSSSTLLPTQKLEKVFLLPLRKCVALMCPLIVQMTVI